MPLTKEQKQNILKDLTDKFNRAKAAILVDFNKLSVSKAMELRRHLKLINAEYKVAKKTLINRVLRFGKFEDAKLDSFKTQVGVVFGYNDPVPVANSIWKFSKTNEALKILGGFLGLNWQGKDGIIAATREHLFKAVSPSVKVRSTVGAGDCTIAGLALKLAYRGSLMEACRLAVAMGTAAVLTTGTELCHRADVERLLPQIKVWEIPAKQRTKVFSTGQ